MPTKTQWIPWNRWPFWVITSTFYDPCPSQDLVNDILFHNGGYINPPHLAPSELKVFCHWCVYRSHDSPHLISFDDDFEIPLQEDFVEGEYYVDFLAKKPYLYVVICRELGSWCTDGLSSSSILPVEAFLSFFLTWVSKTQPNHWTKRRTSTRLATEDPRTCPGLEDLSIT